ncbi:MAG: hypothetical protein AMXMBFR80_23590 [Dehalococcoidia bacterium]|nr:hypothetical protein [Tepidiformaceae bacterium]
MRKTIARLRAPRARNEGEAGQGLAEYALILTFVALVCIVALRQLGVAIASSPGFTDLPGVL